MKLNLGYPRLCLCLFFLLLMASCIAKRNGNVHVSPLVKNNNVYQLQVKIVIHSSIVDLPVEFTPYLVQPYNIKYWDNTLVSRPEALILYFRFIDLNLLQQCRDQLLSTGQVEQLTVTTIEKSP